MNITDYRNLADQVNFEEYPRLFNPGTGLVSSIVTYADTDGDLKIYLTKLILCRSFYGTYTAWYEDVNWFIKNFFAEFEGDHIKPDISDAISEAIEMILANQPFTKGIIGTTFMFGIVEFYAKYKLGFRPFEFNFFDKNKKAYIKKLDPKLNRDITIKSAFEFLQKANFPISSDLNEIDNFTIRRLEQRNIPSTGWTPHKIADRLNLARNPMVHGEFHNFYNIGPYLAMLYILFHLHDKKDNYS